DPRRDRHELERGALDARAPRDELERELERRRNDLPQRTDLHLDRRHAPLARVRLRDPYDRLGDRELVHQQIRGSGSPTSMSSTGRPPNAVSTSTSPDGSARTSPISAARSQPATERSAASASQAASGATKASSVPSFATYIGSMPRISHAPETAGWT